MDYTTACGAIIAPAVRGIGTQLVLLIDSKPAFDLVAESQVKSVEALRGRAVGISSRGGSVDLLTRLILERHRLNRDKDVTVLVIGTQQEMMVAVKTGRISAALLTPPRNLMLYRDGFHKLAAMAVTELFFTKQSFLVVGFSPIV